MDEGRKMLTVNMSARLADTSVSVLHMIRFEAASIDELGSSSTRTVGFPTVISSRFFSKRTDSTYQSTQWQD